MADPATCDLCDGPLGDGGGRFARLELCGPCWAGDPTPRVAHRGFTLKTAAQRTVIHTNNGSVASYDVDVTGAMGQALSGRGTFARRGMLGRLLGRWFGGPRSGDPIFDRMVWVVGAEGTDLPGLLRIAGFQDVVLEALGDDGTFELEDRLVRWQVIQDGTPPDDDRMRRVVAVALHHMARYAELVGVGRAGPGDQSG